MKTYKLTCIDPTGIAMTFPFSSKIALSAMLVECLGIDEEDRVKCTYTITTYDEEEQKNETV